MPSSDYQLPLFAGFDVGGTNVKVGLVDDRGNRVADTRFPTRQELGPERAVEQMARTLDELLARSPYARQDIAAAGLGTPGPMDIAAGKLLTPTNLPAWHQFPIRDRLADALQLPVSFSNDAAAAAFGEYWVGAGQEHDSVVLITLGTGVGGGIIVNGLSLDGAHSHGAEVGHMVVDSGPDARVCSCGRAGHLEAYASATALVARTRDRLSEGAESQLQQQVDETSPLSALMIYRAAMAGDVLACQLIDETAIFLGRGITILAHVIDPSIFLLGGAMDFGGADCPLGQQFLARVGEEVKQHSFPVLAENLQLEFARLGGEAGFVGAAGLGRSQYRQAAVD